MTWQVRPGTWGPFLGFCLSPVPQGPRSLDALLGASTARFLSLNTFLPILSEPLLGKENFIYIVSNHLACKLSRSFATTVRGVGPVGNLTHLLEHFSSGWRRQGQEIILPQGQPT